jgi:large subunit ribosomal protein L29
MKIKEMRELPVDELKARLEDYRDELSNLSIQKSTHQLANPSRIKMVKKSIARINCLLKEYELGISHSKTETKG